MYDYMYLDQKEGIYKSVYQINQCHMTSEEPYLAVVKPA